MLNRDVFDICCVVRSCLAEVLEITMTNLQSSVATDLSDMREEV